MLPANLTPEEQRDQNDGRFQKLTRWPAEFWCPRCDKAVSLGHFVVFEWQDGRTHPCALVVVAYFAEAPLEFIRCVCGGTFSTYRELSEHLRAADIGEHMAAQRLRP